MKKKAMNLNLWGRYVGSLLLGLVIVGSGFYAYFAFVFPSIANSPWPVQLLVVEIIILPLCCLSIYLMFQLFLKPSTGKIFVKGLRQWVMVLSIVYCYFLSFAFFAFIFEEFTPFLPLFYRGIFLPAIINLVLILTLLKTRLMDKLKAKYKGRHYSKN
jgi:NO-binding membrane sensor protein with MHYT domain